MVIISVILFSSSSVSGHEDIASKHKRQLFDVFNISFPEIFENALNE